MVIRAAFPRRRTAPSRGRFSLRGDRRIIGVHRNAHFFRRRIDEFTRDADPDRAALAKRGRDNGDCENRKIIEKRRIELWGAWRKVNSDSPQI